MTGPAHPHDPKALTLLTTRPLSVQATRFTGGLLLLLDVLLLTAMWPIVGVFVIATVVCGLVAGAAMRRWNDAHPITREDRSSVMGQLPDINIGRVPVGGDFGGFLFMCAAIASVVIGLPSVRWFVIASLGCATLAALSLAAVRNRHPFTRTVTHIWSR